MGIDQRKTELQSNVDRGKPLQGKPGICFLRVLHFSQCVLRFWMLLFGASGVQCGLSLGEGCLEPAAEEMGRPASVMRHLSCGLLSCCAVLSCGIENVRGNFRSENSRDG